MLRVPDKVRSTHSEDGGIVLDIGRGQLFSANRVGSRIFELIKSGLSIAQIAAHLSDEFAISQSQANTDLQVFIAELEALQLVEGDLV